MTCEGDGPQKRNPGIPGDGLHPEPGDSVLYDRAPSFIFGARASSCRAWTGQNRLPGLVDGLYTGRLLALAT